MLRMLRPPVNIASAAPVHSLPGSRGIEKTNIEILLSFFIGSNSFDIEILLCIHSS